MSEKYVARFIGGPLCGHEEWTEQVSWPRTVPRCEPGRDQEYGLHLYATGTDSDIQWSDDGAFLLYYKGFSKDNDSDNATEDEDGGAFAMRLTDVQTNLQKKEDEEKREAFVQAVLDGDVARVKSLLEPRLLNCICDDRSYSPLLLAIENNHESLVRLLIDAGASPNVPGYRDVTKQQKLCPLELATECGNENIRSLIASRANRFLPTSYEYLCRPSEPAEKPESPARPGADDCIDALLSGKDTPSNLWGCLDEDTEEWFAWLPEADPEELKTWVVDNEKVDSERLERLEQGEELTDGEVEGLLDEFYEYQQYIGAYYAVDSYELKGESGRLYWVAVRTQQGEVVEVTIHESYDDLWFDFDWRGMVL